MINQVIARYRYLQKAFEDEIKKVSFHFTVSVLVTEIQNFFWSFEKYFMSECSKWVKYVSTWEENFCVCKWPCCENDSALLVWLAIYSQFCLKMKFSLKKFWLPVKPVFLLLKMLMKSLVLRFPFVFYFIFHLDLAVPQGFHRWSKKQACHCHWHHSGKWWVSCKSRDKSS